MAPKQAEIYGVAPSFVGNRLEAGWPEDPWELDRTTLQLGARLGAGQYGEVYRAVWTTHQRLVAVKTLIEGRMVLDDFLREANVMKKVRIFVEGEGSG